MDDVDFAGWTLEKSIQVIQDDRRTRVLVKGRPYMSWPSGDEESVRMATVQLSGCGLGTQEELAKVFGVHVNSVQRYLTDFERQGMRGLLSGRSAPKKRWKLTPELRGKILLIVLREGIGKLEAIQQRLAEAWQEQVSVASIGHFMRDGTDPLEAVRKFTDAGRMYHFHFRDVDKRASDGKDVTLGDGAAQIQEMLAYMKQKGVKPILVFEYERD